MRQLKITKSITNRDSASLDRYLTEVGKQPMITAEEEAALSRRIREGDEDALKQLTVANLRFVVSVAKQFQNQGLSLGDLINEGNIGLIKAARKFDETRGFKFISYAVWWIRQSVMQAIAEQSRIIRIPQNKIGTMNKIRKAQGALEQELERAPTSSEISGSVAITETEIESTITAHTRHLSMDMPVSDDAFTLGDTLAGDVVQPDDGLLKESLRADIEQALGVLSAIERDIIVNCYGIGIANPLSLSEIAIKHGLGSERVRQIREHALKKMKTAGCARQLKTHL